MFNRLLILIYFSYLFVYGYLQMENGNTNISALVIFALLFFGLANSFIQNRIFLPKPVFYFFLFFLFVFISIIFNKILYGSGFEVLQSAVSSISILLWPLIFFYFSQQKFRYHSIQKVFKLLRFLGIIVALNCLIPLVLYLVKGTLVGELVVSNGKIRSFGFLSDQVGFALVYFLIDALYRKKYFYVLLYALAIISTGTRAAILSGALSCLITWFYGKKRVQSASKIRAVLIMGTVLMIYFIFLDSEVNSFFDVFDLRLNSLSVASTGAQRFSAIKAGISIFLDHPIFGIGYGNFVSVILHDPQLLSLFSRLSIGSDQNRGFANAQNQLVDIAANGGLACIAAVSFFLYHCIKRLRYLIRTSDLSDEFSIVLIYLVSLLLFNQSAVYLFNFGICSLLLMILLGLANARQALSILDAGLYKLNLNSKPTFQISFKAS